MVVEGAEGTGERIKTLRMKLGLSQIQLAALLGVSNVTVNRWENGKSAPGEATLHHIEALAGSFRRPAGLPVPATPFVGRTVELVRLPALVTEERVVTLLGPSGSGKTRLAVEVTSRSADAFAGGASFVDLAPLLPGADVAARAGDALGLKDGGTTPMLDRLAGALADRSLLLVLDNCEHVVAGCRVLLDQLLRDCTGLRVLATSQVPLGLAGEIRWVLPPLPVPSPDAGPESIAGSDAVALFVLRARHRQRDFTLSPEVAPTVATICRRLDGLPLAIELSATQMRRNGSTTASRSYVTMTRRCRRGGAPSSPPSTGATTCSTIGSDGSFGGWLSSPARLSSTRSRRSAATRSSCRRCSSICLPV